MADLPVGRTEHSLSALFVRLFMCLINLILDRRRSALTISQLGWILDELL